MAEKPVKNSSQPVPRDSAFAPFRRVARDIWLGLKHRPIRNSSVIALVIVAVVGLGYAMQHLSILPFMKRVSYTDELLGLALSSADAGRFIEARTIAADLRLHDDIAEKDRGIPPYVLGLAMQHDAMDEWNDAERKTLYLLAARYLEEAERAGFPPGREGNGNLQLGRCLFQAGEYAQAIPHLLKSLEKLPEPAPAVYQLLTTCYLRDQVPNLEQASAYNQKFLATPALSEEDRDLALLTEAKILFELGRTEECQQRLHQFADDSKALGEARLLEGRMRLRQGDALRLELGESSDTQRKEEATQEYESARELLIEAQEVGPKTGEFQSEAQYLLGLVYRRLGDLIQAEEQFSRSMRAQIGAPQGIAAGLELAEVQHLLNNDKEALVTFRRTLRAAVDDKNPGAPWLTDEDLRRRVEDIFQVYRQEQRYAQATDLMKSLFQMFPDARTVEGQANVYQEWADDLQQRVTDDAPPPGPDSSIQARDAYREAGKLFAQLARLRFGTRDYAMDVWRSAENYLNGQDYDHAVQMYERLMDYQPRKERPAVLVRLGEANLGRNRPAAALESLNEVIDSFPKDPFVYRGRLVAAEANVELGQMDRAKQLLMLNLENSSLTPQSREWRDSLFLLGKIHFQEGVVHESRSRETGVDSALPSERQEGLKELLLAQQAFRESTRRLSEAVQRDPNATQAIGARYMLAQAYLQSAKYPKKQLGMANIETTSVMLRRELEQELQAAAQAFEDLKSRLVTRQEKTDLSPVEHRILRNCYFGRADALFDLKQYDEAIQAYASASSRYQHEPESLEAYIQIANCHRRLDRPAESRRTLEQAKLVLNRIRPDADFLATTRYDRQEWNDLLDWLSTL